MDDQRMGSGVSVQEMADSGDVPVTSAEMAAFGLQVASSDLVDVDEEGRP